MGGLSSAARARACSPGPRLHLDSAFRVHTHVTALQMPHTPLADACPDVCWHVLLCTTCSPADCGTDLAGTAAQQSGPSPSPAVSCFSSTETDQAVNSTGA
jgi:hypothetical protein